MAKPIKPNAQSPVVPAVPPTGYQSVGIKKEEIAQKPAPAGQQYVLQSDGTYKLFAKPTGQSAPQPTVLQPKEPEQPDSISGVVKQTYAEQAESQLYGQFKTDYENALKFGIQLPYKDFEGYKKWVQGDKQGDVDYLQKQQDLARGIEDIQTTSALEGIEAAKKGVTATMAQGREGAMTTSKPQFTQEFAGRMQRQIDQIKLERDSAEAQRQQAMKDLKRAQESGDVQLAQAIQGQLSSIETNIREIDAQALQASTLANEQALKAAQFESDKSIAEQASQRANLTTFTELVNAGTELSTEGIMQFAQSLNVPFEAAYNYYSGSQKVRDDKNLSLEEKQIQNAKLAQDLNDTITGQNIATVKQWSILENMYKSGASQEEISRAKDAFGFKDENDPVYKLDLQIKQAEAKMKTAEANGEIISPIDKLDYAAKVAELMEKTGGTGSYKPVNSKYEVTATANGIVVNVPVNAKGQPVNGRGQCGEFVNDVLGIGVGDTLKSKTDFIDYSIVVPSAGMAFVSPKGYDLGAGKGNSGHIGIVESVNADGTFNTVEANEHGDEKITRRQNVPITEVVGFIRPPNAEFIGNVGSGEYSETQTKILDKLAGIDPKDIDTTTLKVLQDAGLTTSDLLSYTPTKKPKELTPMAESARVTAEQLMDKFKNGQGTSAVGFSRVLGLQNIPGTPQANFITDFNTLKSQLSLDAVKYLKGQGAVSDAERALLAQSVSKLDLAQSEGEFEKTLQQIIDTLSPTQEASPEDDFVSNLNLDDILLDQYLTNLK